MMADTFPTVYFRREVTIGHLLADYEHAKDVGGKVNPPLRSRGDVESLWEHLLAGNVSWVSSDHGAPVARSESLAIRAATCSRPIPGSVVLIFLPGPRH